MSDLIRGGQVSLHKYRMFCQVSKVLAKMSVVIIISSIIYCYYNNISNNEWEIGFAWIKKEIIEDFNPNYQLSYPSKNGVIKKVKLQYFQGDPYVKNSLAKFQIVLYKSLIVAAIMQALLVGSVLFYFWYKGRELKQNLNIRGVFLISAKDLKKAIGKHNGIFKKYQPFKLADFSFPITGREESWSAGEQSHTLILGSTGAGKTKIIQHLVYQLHKRNQKAIIVDVKGDYIEHFYQPKREDIILNPLDNRGRNWSIFKETNPLKGFSTIAKSLLPKESKNDPIWVDAARAVFAELANLYVSENLSMAIFADKILKSDIATLTKLLEKTGASKIINPDIEKAALSVLMVLSTYLRPLKLYQNSEDCFSITDWVNDDSQNNFLFISSRSDVKEDINPLITTQVDIAVNAIRSLKEQSNIPKLWFILDEIPYFEQSIPSLKDGLAMSRSYGGCFVLGSQDISSLSKIYSENTARAIANNCKTKIYMNIAGKETAEYCSGALGEGEVKEWHEGLSYGAHEMRDGIQVNHNKVIRRTVLPSELMLLNTGEGFINFAGFKPAKFKFEDCSFKKIAPSYLENTALLELFKQELEIGEQRRKEIEAKLAISSSTETEISLTKNTTNHPKLIETLVSTNHSETNLDEINQVETEEDKYQQQSIQQNSTTLDM